MLRRAYYTFKPFIPPGLRLAMRRVRAQRILKECGATWPIFEASGAAPEGWPGWPDGQEFAVVLTHDVEGQRGLDRCRQLAEIEMEHGFRSSFNFIPNGTYEVPEDLLQWLRANGFEIGLHDYRHDGTLFRSRTAFERDAVAMNQQLKKWGAVGFRAGFMLHKLDWLHALDIEYDSSTFDVDPFEPQPDGAQTIFPFWVPKPNPEADALRGRSGSSPEGADSAAGAPGAGSDQGYIELPYTLVQDYNHFIVLQKKGIEIWKRKLRWLVEKRAMAMLDTHPDYMAMPGSTPGPFEFPIQYYRDFLDHVRTEYAGRYWQALPREVAAYCRPFKPKQARPPRRVAMLAYSFYEYDGRIRRYAETLAERGDDVSFYCLGKPEQVATGQWETLNGVRILRLQTRENTETSKWSHARRLLSFLWRSFRHMGPRDLPDGCDLLHVHNIPDFLVFAGMRLKARGTRVILDIHDIVPELYESKFADHHGSLIPSLLRKIEKLSCQFADHVIIANHIWKKTILSRSASAEKVTAFINNVDLKLFAPRPRRRHDDRFVLLYPGSLNRHQGLDVAIEAVRLLAPDFPQLELHIYGDGPALPFLKEQAQKLDLGPHVQFFNGVPLHEVPQLMANADVGIVPKLAEGFGDQAYSTKIMEFMSQGLPVVLSRTRIDSLYFDDSVAAFFQSGNAEDMARALRRVISDPAERRRLSEQGRAYAIANSWDTMREVYLEMVDRLTMTSVPSSRAVTTTNLTQSRERSATPGALAENVKS